MNVRNYSETAPWMASPTSSNHSRNSSPGVSPGNWNVASPSTVTSSGSWARSPPSSTSSNTSYTHSLQPHSPSSSASSVRSTTTHDFIGLPKQLGMQTEIVKRDAQEIRRQKIAEAKARKLLQQSWAQEPGCARTPASPPRSCPEIDDEGYALRQEAIRRYKEKKRLEKLGGANGESSSVLAMIPPAIAMNASKEKLATSTRKKKVEVTPEEDFETIDDFKSVYEIERAQDAQKMALRLLSKYGLE